LVRIVVALPRLRVPPPLEPTMTAVEALIVLVAGSVSVPVAPPVWAVPTESVLR
jgi:hypothetical protein